MKFFPVFLILSLHIADIFAQSLPIDRRFDWTRAGASAAATLSDYFIDFQELMTDFSNTDTALVAAFALLPEGGTVHFPAGVYNFTQTVNVPSNISITGAGANHTQFIFDLAQAGNAFNILGNADVPLSFLSESAARRTRSVIVENSTDFSVDDYIKIGLIDTDLVTSAWAENSVGQITQILDIVADTLVLSSQLRLDYTTEKEAYVQKLKPAQNVNFSCFKIINNTVTEEQTSNFKFDFAVNCRVENVESENCNFGHLTAQRSAHLTFTGNYLHHAHDYGGGGKAYGAVLQMLTSECLIENNVFEHLRHSVLLQAGANGNVTAYNYSIDPFWTGTLLPSNAAGDLVLHGNYTFANLFEGNTVQNIVIDDSHGANGPGNTFFRNRTESYGVVMNQNPATDSVNFVGNEITGGGLWWLAGTGHYLFGNNLQGGFSQNEDILLSESSLFRPQQPEYFTNQNIPFPTVGLPAAVGERLLPAESRYAAGVPILGCGEELPAEEPQDPISTSTAEVDAEENIRVYPNPTAGFLRLDVDENDAKFNLLQVFDAGGGVKITRLFDGLSQNIDLSAFAPGVYFILLSDAAGNVKRQRVVKI